MESTKLILDACCGSQDKDEKDRDEYRVGIKVDFGVCHCFHPDDYELIK